MLEAVNVLLSGDPKIIGESLMTVSEAIKIVDETDLIDSTLIALPKLREFLESRKSALQLKLNEIWDQYERLKLKSHQSALDWVARESKRLRTLDDSAYSLDYERNEGRSEIIRILLDLLLGY